MSSEFIMDTVSTQSRVYVGVVDFASAKHVMFYDFSQNNNPDIVSIAIIWKTYYSGMRFSVFASLYFSHIDIGNPIMLNRKTITGGVELPKPVRPKRRVVKTLTIESPKD